MLDRIAIMGAGSLGTIFGAFVSKAGRQIDLIDANKEHVDALNANGARVVGNLDMLEPVKALTPDRMEGAYDLFIYLAKQTSNGVCLPQMKKHSHDKTIVCTGQNGIPEGAVCEVFPEERVFGSPVNWGATLLRPGVSESTTAAESRKFTLGTVLGPVTPELLEVKSILEIMCPVEISEDLRALRWAKLLINAAYSGLSAVIGGTYGDVSDNRRAIECAVRVGRECIRCGVAMGISIESLRVKNTQTDNIRMYDFSTAEEEAECVEIAKSLNEVSRPLVASMLQDLRKGIKCEINAINGVVVDAGRKYGVSTPYNEAVVRIVKMKEAGEIPVDSCPLDMMPTEL